MRPNSLFIEEDFLYDPEQNQEAFMKLPIEYRHPLSFYVGSSTGLDQYNVKHDLNRCIECTCIGNAEYHRKCIHMKRGNAVLQRRKERLEKTEVQHKVETSIPDVVLSASKSTTPLMSGRPGFHLFK